MEVRGKRDFQQILINLKFIRLTEKSLAAFKNDIGRFPTTEEGLKVLVRKPYGTKNWRGPYLPSEKIFTDVWGNRYAYMFPSEYGEKDFDLYSFGKNQKDDCGSGDDISNWSGCDKRIYENDRQLYLTLLRIIFFIIIFSACYKFWKIKNHDKKSK